jgi:hypothetical protein
MPIGAFLKTTLMNRSFSKAFSGRHAATFALAVFLLLVVVVYFPGLFGGFVYDDWGSITGNANVQIHDGSWAEWMRAALSFPSGTPPFRSLTMLSFAINHYFGGLDPFGYKLINLVIHLLNGVLLFLLLRALFALRNACLRAPSGFNEGLAAAAISGLWMLLPINLTAVLYVVQRLESLACTFVFLGLWWYLLARLRVWQGRGGVFGLWLAIGICSGVGILAKEPAAMLPLYAAAAEWCLCKGRNADGRLSRPVIGLYVVTLLLPLMLGLFWLWGTYISFDLFTGRNHQAIDRLLTEARIMFDYMRWALLPRLDDLTLYHDDIVASKGLLDPTTTLASMLGIALMVAAALWQRRQRPLFALGILWFFAGHILTGTIIPLILAFEHRNYFSSAGLLLAVASLLRLESSVLSPRIAFAAAVAGTAFYSVTTSLRAREWADPLRLASSDAIKRPESPNAQYDYAQALLIRSMQTHDQGLAQTALKVLDRGRHLQGAGIHFEQSMITLLGESGYPAPAEIWESMTAKLVHDAPDTNEIHALSRLNHCFSNKQCKEADLPQFSRAWDAAMSHTMSVGLYSVHAEFAWHVINDRAAAERDFREALRHTPNDIEAQKNLIVVLIYEGKRVEAASMIEAMERRNRFGMLDGFIDPLRHTLETVDSEHSASAD